MRDLLFYPLLVLAIAGILAMALLPGRVPPATDEELAQGYTLTGTDLEQLTAAPGTLLSFTSTSDGTILYAVMATNLPRKMASASAGIFVTLGPQYESYFAGKNLKMTVVARQGTPNPLESFDVGYFTVGAGDSGWKNFKLTSNFTAYSFMFTPKVGANSGNDYFGVWPGTEGRSQTMEVQSMSVEIITP